MSNHTFMDEEKQKAYKQKQGKMNFLLLLALHTSTACLGARKLYAKKKELKLLGTRNTKWHP